MRSLITSLALALLSGLVMAQKPALEFSDPGWDFGRRIQGAVDSKTIEITNNSQRTVKIKISKTCGCIETKARQMTIEAGDTADLYIGLDTKRGEGEIKKFVLLETDDPAQRLYNLPMTGFIETVWNLSSTDINLDKLRRKPGTIASFEISFREGAKTKITMIMSHAGRFDAKQVPIEKGKDGRRRIRVDLALVKGAETGHFEDVILVGSDDKDIPQRMVRLSGQLLTSTTVTPNQLAFGLLKPDVDKSLTLKVVKSDGDGMRVVEVVCENPHIKTEVKEVTKGKVWEVKVTARPKAGQRDLRGTLRIRIDEPGEIVHKVNFYGRVLLP